MHVKTFEDVTGPINTMLFPKKYLKYAAERRFVIYQLCVYLNSKPRYTVYI